MNAEPLSYCARLKQRADVCAVTRLASSFLDLWADDAAEGSDEERAELAKARAEFDAVRSLVEAAPDLHRTLADIADWYASDTSDEGDMPAELFDRMTFARRFDRMPISAPDHAAMLREITEAADRDIYTDAPESAEAVGRMREAIERSRLLLATGAPTWTVLLLRPDYLADNYGTDTFLAHVTAPTADTAVLLAQDEAAKADSNADGIDVESPDDYAVLLVIRGHHSDVAS